MRGVRVDPTATTARADGGATWGDFNAATHAFGLATTGGIISTTGVGGLTLGGGIGYLARGFGLSLDNLVAADVVTADGRFVTASERDHEDLFWALRGGGGNFGVVTSFEYRVHPVSTVLGGLILYPRDQATTVLRHYREFMKSAPDELTVYAGLLSAPDGTPVVALIACHCGDLKAGEAALKPLRAFGAPLMDAIQPMPFPKMQSLLDGGFPDGALNYWKSAFLRELGDDAIQTVIDHASRALSPQTAVVLEYYGGAAGRIGASETAFAHREAAYSLGILCRWTDPAESPRQIAWTRGFAEAMRPYYSGAYLLNFLDAEEQDTIRAAFGSNYDRLVAVKNRYDPTNFFQLNQNIKPTV
jgi:FAD/FMN-containing dehydrogenase